MSQLSSPKKSNAKNSSNSNSSSASAVTSKDIEVKKEDQMQINRFSMLNADYTEMEEEISRLEKEVVLYKDAEEEVTCCLEADGLLYKFGDSFIPQDDMSCSERLEKSRGKMELELGDLKDSAEKMREEIDSTKKALYAKFGNSINLEM